MLIVYGNNVCIIYLPIRMLIGAHVPTAISPVADIISNCVKSKPAIYSMPL